jgi:hypothetical protein
MIRNHLASIRSACRVITPPGVLPRVRSDTNFRIPDIGLRLPIAALYAGTWLAEA